ncbi:MAG: small ribosomal subunit Rsm22 family protein [Parachlamydiales bacterium]|nr:small ribosomal subunit Rsm22 family protein [Parachlamydiales bacterium]
MQLPSEIQTTIESFFENVSTTVLRKARESLTSTYKEGGASPFDDEAKRLAYLGARMPATYAAVRKALENVRLTGHLLDLGAGPGTASWAALDLFPDLEKITLIEKNAKAIELGKTLARFHPILKNGNWIQQVLNGPIPNADSAILSYVLNELDSPEKIVENVWNAVNTIVIIEPGTPKAFQLVKKLREQLIQMNAHIIAPCPHALACPNDWCHFSARVERTRLHRLLKEGTLGFEDEKFCYLIASKSPGPSFSNRIIRHPNKQSGFVRLSLCTEEGTLIEKTVSKKDKQFYRQARDSEWGDVLNAKR